jgi:hypothetical protein
MGFPGQNRRWGGLIEGFTRRSEWFRRLRVGIFFA